MPKEVQASTVEEELVDAVANLLHVFEGDEFQFEMRLLECIRSGKAHYRIERDSLNPDEQVVVIR